MELLFKEQIGNVVFIESDVYRYVSSLLEEIEEYIEDTETFDEFQELFFTGY